MSGIGSPLSPNGREQVVHYDRLKPYTVGLVPAASSHDVPASSLSHAPLLLVGGLRDGDRGLEEPPGAEYGWVSYIFINIDTIFETA